MSHELSFMNNFSEFLPQNPYYASNENESQFLNQPTSNPYPHALNQPTKFQTVHGKRDFSPQPRLALLALDKILRAEFLDNQRVHFTPQINVLAKQHLLLCSLQPNACKMFAMLTESDNSFQGSLNL